MRIFGANFNPKIFVLFQIPAGPCQPSILLNKPDLCSNLDLVGIQILAAHFVSNLTESYSVRKVDPSGGGAFCVPTACNFCPTPPPPQNQSISFYPNSDNVILYTFRCDSEIARNRLHLIAFYHQTHTSTHSKTRKKP